jgi:hypothetical protein
MNMRQISSFDGQVFPPPDRRSQGNFHLFSPAWRRPAAARH